MSSAPPTDVVIPPMFSKPADPPTEWRRVAVLADNTPVDVLIKEDTTTIAVNGKVEAISKTLPKELKLVISGVGTQYEHVSDHLPAFNLLEISPPSEGHTIAVEDFWGIIYALHTILHLQEHVPIAISESFANQKELREYLIQTGLARRRHVGVYEPEPDEPELYLIRASFWQGAGSVGWHNRGWIQGSSAFHASHPFPFTPSFTRSHLVIAGHPLRPPKPRPGELIYRRYFPQYGQSFELNYIDLEEDKLGPNGVGRHLETFNKWHNDPFVARGWNESGPIEHHRKYLKELDADGGCMPVMMSWDGELFGYTELVYVRENHVSQYVPQGAWEYDRGLHCLVGEPKYRKDGRSALWFASIMHYLFLADCRTERLIGEPKNANPGIVGLSIETEMKVHTVVDLPYKRSALTWQTRDRFFRYDLLIRSEEPVDVRDDTSKQLARLRPHL